MPVSPLVEPLPRVSALDDLPSIPGERRRGLRIASVALLIAVLAAGGLIAAYLIHVGGSSDASATTAHTTGPTTQPGGHVGVDRGGSDPHARQAGDATSYDPQGDGSESEFLAPERSMGTRRRPGAPRPTRGR